MGFDLSTIRSAGAAKHLIEHSILVRFDAPRMWLASQCRVAALDVEQALK